MSADAENLRVAGAHTVVENMRHGMPPKEAILDCLKRVSRNFDNYEKRMQPVDLNFYALRKDGEYAAGSLWNKRVVNSQTGARFAVCQDGVESRLKTPCIFWNENKRVWMHV